MAMMPEHRSSACRYKFGSSLHSFVCRMTRRHQDAKASGGDGFIHRIGARHSGAQRSREPGIHSHRLRSFCDTDPSPRTTVVMDSGFSPHGLPRNDGATNLRQNAFCPTGKSPCLLRFIRSKVKPSSQKYLTSVFRNHMIISARPRPARGTYRDRHGRWAGDAMDVVARETGVAIADGEIAWS